MIDKLTAGMKSWIKQDYQNICESPAEYGISYAEKEFGKFVGKSAKNVECAKGRKIYKES